MPSHRLQWHLVKCKTRRDRQNAGLKEYHCKHNYMHILLTQDELQKHEEECNKEQEKKEQENIRQGKILNWGLKGEKEEGVNDDSWQEVEKAMETYREGQNEDKKRYGGKLNVEDLPGEANWFPSESKDEKIDDGDN